VLGQIQPSSPLIMRYSSDLSDAEWELLEPLLVEILPAKKQTRPSAWTRRQLIDAMLYQLKSGCNWCDLPKDFPPYSTVYWHYKQWRDAGAWEALLEALHERVRQLVKKKRVGRGC
jgi:transposase